MPPDRPAAITYMKPFSKSFQAACRVASGGNEKPSTIRRFCTEFQNAACVIPEVSSFEAEILCETIWHPDFPHPNNAHEVGVVIAGMLLKQIEAVDWDLNDSDQEAIFFALIELALKMSMLLPESTYLLYAAISLMQHAPHGSKITDFLIIKED